MAREFEYKLRVMRPTRYGQNGGDGIPNYLLKVGTVSGVRGNYTIGMLGLEASALLTVSRPYYEVPCLG